MVSEDFEIIITAGEAEEIFGPDGYRREFINSVLEDLNTEGIETSNAITEARSYGYGADGITLAVTLVGLSFLSGKKILENIDAWAQIGKKISNVIKRINKRQFGIRFSEHPALALAIANLVDTHKSSDISLLNNIRIPIPNASLLPNLESVFKQQPDLYYIFIFKIGREFIKVLCITSHGQIVFSNILPLDYAGFNFSYGSLGLPDNF